MNNIKEFINIYKSTLKIFSIILREMFNLDTLILQLKKKLLQQKN